MEAMNSIPGAKPIEGAFLLSASLSSDYPLNQALRMTRRGIVNVYNPEDEILNSGTAMFGNVDGKKGPSCGRTGLTRKYPIVFNRRITARELGTRGDAHFIATNADVIARYAPAWIKAKTWPPPRQR
jgi:hypothetical protein